MLEWSLPLQPGGGGASSAVPFADFTFELSAAGSSDPSVTPPPHNASDAAWLSARWRVLSAPADSMRTVVAYADSFGGSDISPQVRGGRCSGDPLPPN